MEEAKGQPVVFLHTRNSSFTINQQVFFENTKKLPATTREGSKRNKTAIFWSGCRLFSDIKK